MKKHLKLIIALFIVIAAAAIYFLFFHQPEEDAVISTAVVRGNVSQEVNATGASGAVQLFTAGAQASGEIEKLFVKPGQ